VLSDLDRDTIGGAAISGSPPLVVFAPYEGEQGTHVNREVRAAWRSMVRKTTKAYLLERAAFFKHQLALGRPAVSTHYGVSDDIGVDGFGQQLPGLNDVRRSYVRAFESQPGRGGALHVPFVYLVLGLAGAAVLAWLDLELRAVWIGTALLQLALQAVILFTAPVEEYRFELFQVVLGLMLAIMASWAVHARRHAARLVKPSPRPVEETP